MDITEFKQKYIEDVLDLLDNLDNDLVNFEKDFENTECIEQVFRVMHTIKGTSGMYGFDKIAKLTHDLESIFTMVSDNTLKVTTELLNLTLTSVDHIRNLLTDPNLTDPLNISLHGEIERQLEIILKINGINNESRKVVIQKEYDNSKIRTWQILFMPSEEIIKRSINILFTLQDLLKLGTYRIQEPNFNEDIKFWSIFVVTDSSLEDIEDSIFLILDYCRIQLVGEFDIFREEEYLKRQKEIEDDFEYIPESASEDETKQIINFEPKRSSKEKFSSNRIYVDSTKLDRLMFLVSELVTTKSELFLSIETKKQDKIIECAKKVDSLSKMFRDNALSIRLISLHELFLRFNRLVRDLSTSLGKIVEFETVGDEIELDKNIVDSISEPLIHLIRNCIDHGIETPEDRIKINKPETGIVKLFAYKSGNFVFIQISDDGKGLDKEKILEKAVSKGLIKENSQLKENEIYDLIFLPGFSTAENLSQVSGRGVGMDIVRKKIQEIRGEINIDSEPGLGTSFTLKLQQTISIIDTLLVRTNNSKYAIPVDEIDNCQMIDTSVLRDLQNHQLSYNKQLIPYISLRDEFNYYNDLSDKQRVIIINKHESFYAIIVDEIIGEYQAVVKPMGETFSDIEFISGASLLGDGSIALLLDTDKLKKLLVKENPNKS